MLQRAGLADAFAAEIRRTSAKHGAVVALTGKWGSGKTSLLNLTSSALEAADDVQVVKFNPWFFSGTDQLMRFFFDELAGQLRDGRGLKDKLKSAGRTVAERLGRYSSALSPLNSFLVPVPSWEAQAPSPRARPNSWARSRRPSTSRGRNSLNSSRTCRGGSWSSSTTSTA
ncbi:P-loop NTPase fold protein [Streptomyces avermitilis]|uniref:P-loop NTPase fold protein n=1 Tax=Streptomyces avermitilis TaxID=33903 RepID=UPI00382D6A1D